MSGDLPIIDQLYDCQSDAERADWLLRVPQAVLLRDEMAIRLALRAAGFLAGVDYLDCELSALRSVRGAKGSWRDGVCLSVGALRQHLHHIAKGGGL
ncbi:hypothetical protein NAC44_08050 [Allorhizobium sp. BGMRC 0089]|uniref:hypothetical protein n=1 Tax=Allorhizobium sonneratiae TaxID=2934936 RepID=UPI002033C29D|nr:hypothetical protein [Allorhizobium sonneratiae]MCM2292278.1 hypothetical protein [Allorhizobium sonneratiae]